eukprot:jgi/Galph1/2108/GphlegSOOS_G802.1
MWKWVAGLMIGYLTKHHVFKDKKSKLSSENSLNKDAYLWLVLWQATCVATVMHRGRYYSFPTKQPYILKVIACCELLREFGEVQKPTVLAAYLLRDVLLYRPSAIYSLSSSFDTELLQTSVKIGEEKSILNSHFGPASRQNSEKLSRLNLSTKESNRTSPLRYRSVSNASMASSVNPSASLASALEDSLNLSSGSIILRNDWETASLEEFSDEDKIKSTSSLTRTIYLAEILFHLREFRQILETGGPMTDKSLQYCQYTRQVLSVLKGTSTKLENEILDMVNKIESLLETHK